MALTDSTIKATKPSDKRKCLYDEGGLYLEVNKLPRGSKLWRLKYRLDGTERRMSLGNYSSVSLKQARDRRDEVRTMVSKGIDPIVQKQASKQSDTRSNTQSFEIIAREWHLGESATWAEGHAKRILQRLEADIFPYVGTVLIDQISVPVLLEVLRRVEERGAIETAHRLRRTCGQIFRFAIATGRAVHNPARDLDGALKPYKNGHFAAVTDPVRLGAVLRTLDGYTGTLPVRCAMKLMPMLMVRPGELRSMRWADVDLDAGEWRFTASKTKTELVVPLATQAVEILTELELLTGRGEFAFPNPRTKTKPMSENAVRAGMLGIGLSGDEVTAHGFRATARTLLDEVLKERPEIIEHQLGHTVRDPLGRAYNRTTFLAERKLMMQRWADYLDKLREGAKLLSIQAVAT